MNSGGGQNGHFDLRGSLGRRRCLRPENDVATSQHGADIRISPLGEYRCELGHGNRFGATDVDPTE